VLVSGLALLAGHANGAAQAPRPAPGAQKEPVIVFDGADYLVAWTNVRKQSTRALSAASAFRPQLPPPPPPPPRAALYGARVTKTGRALDQGGIAISTAEFNEYSRPAVASDGTDALFVWTDRRNGMGLVQGARVLGTGFVSDPAAIDIWAGPDPPGAYGAAVAFDGVDYLVAWATSSIYEQRIYATFVTPSGLVPRPTPIEVTSGDRYGMYPAVAFDGVNYLVAWVEYHEFGASVHATRVSRAGVVLDPDGILVDQNGSIPKIAFNGTNYLLVYGSYGKRISRSGQVLDSQPIPIAPTGSGDSDAVSSDGTDYFVAWADTRFGCCSIFGTRVSPSGAVLDPAGIAIATHGREQRDPAIGFDGTNYVVAWTDNRGSSTDIYGARVATDGRVLDPRGILVSTAAPLKPRCVVPRVTGMRLKRARSKIRRAHCSVAGVRTRAAKKRRGRVVAQSPRPRTTRPLGFPVRIVVGR
jgi:hypothetical protein